MNEVSPYRTMSLCVNETNNNLHILFERRWELIIWYFAIMQIIKKEKNIISMTTDKHRSGDASLDESIGMIRPLPESASSSALLPASPKNYNGVDANRNKDASVPSNNVICNRTINSQSLAAALKGESSTLV